MAMDTIASTDGDSICSLKSPANTATSNDELNPNQSATSKNELDPNQSAICKEHVKIHPDCPESIEDMFRLMKEDKHEVIDYAGEAIIQALESTMMLASLTSNEQKARHFIKEVDAIAPFNMKPEEFAYELRETFVTIASYTAPRSSLQDVLVKAFALLAADNWRYIKDIGIEVREAWHLLPCPTVDDSDGRQYTDSEWINLNSFLAKLFSERIVSWMNFPMWEVKAGLEYSLSDVQDPSDIDLSVADTRIRVAAEWMFQSAPRLLFESLLGIPTGLPEKQREHYLYCCGPLYPYKDGKDGMEGYSIERWGFWKRRFREMRAEVKEDLYGIIDDAVMTMTKAEIALGELANLASERRVEKETQTDPELNLEPKRPVEAVEAELHPDTSESTTDTKATTEPEKGKEIEIHIRHGDMHTKCEVHVKKKNDLDIKLVVE